MKLSLNITKDNMANFLVEKGYTIHYGKRNKIMVSIGFGKNVDIVPVFEMEMKKHLKLI